MIPERTNNHFTYHVAQASKVRFECVIQLGATHKCDQQVQLTSVINRCDSQVQSIESSV